MGKLIFHCITGLIFYIILGSINGNVDRDPCSLSREERCRVRQQEWIFCNGLPPSNISSPLRIKGLFLCNVKGPLFDPKIISSFPQLQALVLVNSTVSQFEFHFPYHKDLQTLNLSRLQLEFLHKNTFVKLKALKVIDLSNNKFKKIGASVFDRLLSLQKLYLKGNTWNCSVDLTWMVGKISQYLQDPEEMICGQEKYYGKPVVSIMTFAKTLQVECPKEPTGNCKCILNNVVWSPEQDYLIPVTTVNCTNLGLQTLPTTLPSNTTVLLLNNNNISDLSPLVTERTYRLVADIYLEHNLVESVDKLEGAAWLLTFRVFSLKANRIKKLPTYAFDNAFEKNSNAAKVFLGNNPWTCDCVFTPMFKELLVKHRTLIQDSDDIKCFSNEKDDILKITIRDLSISSICQGPTVWWISPLDLLNLLLSLFILFIIGKFFYDYWIYRRTGKLPWIALRLL